MRQQFTDIVARQRGANGPKFATDILGASGSYSKFQLAGRAVKKEEGCKPWLVRKLRARRVDW